MFLIFKNLTIQIIMVLMLDVCDEEVSLIKFEYINGFIPLSGWIINTIQNKPRTYWSQSFHIKHNLFELLNIAKYFIENLQVFFFLSFFLNGFFSHTVHPNRLSSHSIPLSFPQLPFSPVSTAPPSLSLEKRAGIQETIVKHNKTKYCKTRQKPSHWGWTRQPSRRKRVTGIGKRVESTIRSLTETPS